MANYITRVLYIICAVVIFSLIFLSLIMCYNLGINYFFNDKIDNKEENKKSIFESRV